VPFYQRRRLSFSANVSEDEEEQTFQDIVANMWETTSDPYALSLANDFVSSEPRI
jgi:hypothetical protein